MVLHFENFETAALFAAQRRSEGYFARTLDSNVGHLWGPLPVLGARVVVSEEPIGDDAPAPPPIIWSRYLLPFLNILSMAWILSALFIGLGLILKSAQSPRIPASNPLVGFPVHLLVVTILAPLISLFMIQATRHDRLRQPGDSLSLPMTLVATTLILYYLDGPLWLLYLFIVSKF